MIIGVSDPDNFTFSQQLINHWEAGGHTVKKSLYHEESFMIECDAVFYDFASMAVEELTKFGVKPKRCVVRGIDVELYYNYWSRFNFDLIDSFIFLNDGIKDLFYSQGFNCPRDKVSIVKPGVDKNKFTLKTSSRGKKAVFVGRLWIGKNVVGAVDLVHELNKIDPGWELFIRGDSADPTWWNEYFKRRCQMENFPITVDGRVDDMNKYLEDKDLMIIPSFKEAFSYTACEAMSKGIPTVFNNYLGVDSVWPKELVYNTPSEGARIAKEIVYHSTPEHFRDLAYDEQDMFNKIDKLMGII